MTARHWWIGATTCGVLVIAILVITLSPEPVDRPYAAIVDAIVSNVRAVPGLGWFDYDWLERLSNVVMFAPLGAIVTVLSGRWLAAVAVGLVLSSLVEIAQALLLPDRTASVSDVIANSAGAAIGGLIVVVVRGIRARARRRRGRH
ncbi:VanZ family protein [Galbitalea sp. SE-J8]|uniref:VanZ family protein n=1 Tax=Galbitalea sp. SE-J8 TaxID=3054952 RepID=UPI00259CCAE4|nr:VanZ family protein [Galbitalea sp. SE-J8]MDM4763932.1 VanZ family protein [Galbitalea sp. SE-J8]